MLSVTKSRTGEIGNDLIRSSMKDDLFNVNGYKSGCAARSFASLFGQRSGRTISYGCRKMIGLNPFFNSRSMILKTVPGNKPLIILDAYGNSPPNNKDGLICRGASISV